MLKFPQHSGRENPLIELAPSILSADFARLAEQVQPVLDAGATVLHVDVMDGHFVPNITIGPPVVAALRKHVQAPLDVHLMIENAGACRLAQVDPHVEAVRREAAESFYLIRQRAGGQWAPQAWERPV